MSIASMIVWAGLGLMVIIPIVVIVICAIDYWRQVLGKLSWPVRLAVILLVVWIAAVFIAIAERIT